jgi:DNA (cytosine-5)-methyltransferase 1
MNAKNYGVAQNRDRVFMVSILGKYYYEQPKPIPLEKRLKDYLEPNVDEKYYLSNQFLKYLQTDHPKHKRSDKFAKNVRDGENDNANTITTREGNVIDSTYIKIPEATAKGYAKANDGDGVYINRPHQKRGVVQDQMIQTIKTSGDDVGVVVKGFTEQQAKMITDDGNIKRYLHSEVVDEFNVGDSADISFPNGYDKGKRTYNGIAPALNLTTTESSLITKLDNLRIRKLTPKECWRLMGIDDSYFDKASQVVSKSQLYKQAGNGIVVDVFAHILKELL